MNCNDSADLEKDIFVTHGWKSFCIYDDLSPRKTYRTYVKMEETEDQMWKGDVMVLFGNKIVAKFEQILVSSFALSGFRDSQVLIIQSLLVKVD